MNGDNGYADLVAAAKQIRPCQELAPYKEFDAELAEKYVTEHAPQLTAARAALKRPCRVEVRMVKGFFGEHCSAILALNQLARLIGAEAWLASQRKGLDRVVGCGLDLLRLGNATGRGGMVMDGLLAMGISSSGVSLLRKHRSKFSDEQRQLLIDELQRIDKEHEPMDANIARDREWEIAMNLPTEERDGVERKLDLCEQTLLRLLNTDLALRRFQTAQRVLPNQLHWLVPKFLAAVPVDPFTDSPLIYRRHGEAFELYSTGPKKTDGGGSFTSFKMVSMHQGDLCLDVRDIPDPENVWEIARGG